tara:strand:- start:1529 stop:2458 length:930 start_codon:yes stop_codon:yes gene_type:complete
MKRLVQMSAQPANDYYAWQTEVYLDNFLGLGYNGNNIEVVAAYLDFIPDSWIKLQQKYPHVRFFFYLDDMGECNYPPAVQAHMLKKHFKKFPELSEAAVFFHDCDFIFTKYFDFSKFQHDDNWYFSDTISYVGADYIDSKGEGLLDAMASVVGLCSCKVRANQENSGGAQKLMKNLTAEYWAEVEEDSINLYNWLLQEKDKYGDAEKNDIQIWTASMWSELWNAWKYNHNVIVPKEFDFCWATCHIDKWDTVSFFHNAGVVDSKSAMFFKAGYIETLPYLEDLEIDDQRCSNKYFNAVKATGETSVLID